MMKPKHTHIGVFHTLILWILLSFMGLYATTEVGTEIVNVAYARYQDPGGFEYEIQSPPVTMTVSSGYRLHITKEAVTHVILPSDTAVYHINVENTGNIAVSSLTIIDTLSNGLTYAGSQPAATVNGQIISWDLQNIQPGASSALELRCLVAPGITTGITIENSASYRTAENIRGHSEPVFILIDSKPELTIENTVDPQIAYAGDTLTYTLRVGNSGNAPATNSILYFDLPYEVEAVSISGTGRIDQGIITWPLVNIPEGHEISQSIRAVVNNEVSPGTVLISSAMISSSEEVNANAQSSTQILERTLQPILTLDKTSIPFAFPGDTLTFTISYANTGNTPATEIDLTDSLDNNMIFASSTGSGQYDPLTHMISWTPNDLPDGEEDSVDVTVIVKKALIDGTELETASRITCGESVSTNVSGSTTVRSPQLSFTKTSDSSVVSAGDLITYHLIYMNTGSGRATDVTVRDTLPNEVSYVSSNGSSLYYEDLHLVEWELGEVSESMTAAEDLILTVRSNMPLSNGHVIANTAEITCNEGFTETSSVNVTVSSAPALILNKSVEARAYRGDTLTYVLSFGNEGNGIAPAAQLTDTLPSEVDLISVSGTYNYSEEHHSLVWNIGDLQPGSDSTLYFTARVQDVSQDINDIENIAWIHSQDISLSSNTALTRLNNLILSIEADPDTILGNGVAQSQITVSAVDASGQPAADGTPVVLKASHGSFNTESDTFNTVDGSFQASLTSSVINREYLPVNIKAELTDGSGIADSTTVVFSAMRITGYVIDDDGEPVEGAIITILLDGVVIGTYTTGQDGYYSIPVYGSGKYVIRIQYPDGHGHYNTVDKDLEVNIEDPDSPTTIEDLCSVSGRLIDYNTQEPIYKAGIPVIIDLQANDGMSKMTATELPDTTYTDSTGFFVFTNLLPGNYFIETINDEDDLYHVGNRYITIENPGENKINVDISQRPIIFRIYKTVDKALAFSGDTLTYTLVYQTVDNATTDTIEILDQLPDEVELIPGSMNYSSDISRYDFDPISNELSFLRIGMPETYQDSLTFSVLAKDGITALITNEALIRSRPDTAYTVNDPRTAAQTMILSPILAVSKKVNWPVAETGDVLTYTLTVENKSDSYDLYGLSINDILPQGFRYKAERSVLNGQQTDDPVMTANDHHQHLEWTLNDTLTPGSTLELKYRVVVGLESRIGENTNTASAVSVLTGGYVVQSNIASADVVIKPGMIQARGLIFGKVFYDDNGNHIHDRNEKTLKDIEIITEEGIRVITDEFGKYSIPNVRMGDHVLRVNERTLPENTEISLSSSDFLGDTGSRLVKVSYSGIAKANFPIRERSDLIEDDASQASKSGVMDISQHALTNSMRLVVNDAWSMMLKYSYSPESGNFIHENGSLIDKTVEFLKWQEHLQIEIRQRFDLAETGEKAQTPGKRQKVTTPAQLLFETLKKRGIAANRMHFGEGSQAEQDICENVRSCVVELRLLSDEIMIDQTMSMRHDIAYSNGPVMKFIKLETILPDGFKVKDDSGKLNGKRLDPELKSNGKVLWDLGKNLHKADLSLEYDLVPEDHLKIKTSSELISSLHFKPKYGKEMTSHTLRTNIRTHVDMVRFKVTLEGALFDVGSYALKPAAKRSINRIGEFLQWQKDMSIMIEGFTDNTGSDENNLILSLNRAKSVKDYLEQTFAIAPERIDFRGYGEEFPAADNATAKGRALNRRVEIILKSNFTQKGIEKETILDDEIEMRVEKRKYHVTTKKVNGK